MNNTKEVFLNTQKNTISFVHVPHVNVCIGETEGSLEDFRQFMRLDWETRGLSTDDLPTVETN